MEILSENQICVVEFFSSNPKKIVLNALRVSIAFLYIFWIILVIRIKKLQKRGMAYLYNLAINGLLYAIVGIYYSTWSSCYHPSRSVCYFSSFLTTYLTFYSGYSIGALILYRLICVTHSRWAYNLSYSAIAITIVLVWIIPILCSFIEMFLLTREVSYKPKAQLCSSVYHSLYGLIIFFSIFGIIVPNAIILSAYYVSLTYLKKLRKKISNRRNIEPQRIRVQLVIYIVLYVITCIINLIASIPLNFPGAIIPMNHLETFFYSVRLLNWIRHILPLGLMYFNTDLLAKYRIFLSKIRWKKTEDRKYMNYHDL